MKLYVDVDDTLVIWQPHKRTRADGLYMGDEWQRNDELIEAISKYARIRLLQDEVIIWSTGGEKYTAYWAEKLDLDWPTMEKDPRLPQRGDICIDDELIGVVCRLVRPEQFILAVGLFEGDF